MSIDSSFINALTYAGLSFPTSVTVSSALAIPLSVSLSVAATGTLTTRTDNTTGTLTMAGGHGITTGARLDLYWTGGSRRGITVGTVSVNSVPFSAGAGDNLPVATTAITAQVPTSESVIVTGSNVVSIGASLPLGGTIVFAASDNTEIFAKVLTATNTAYAWASGYSGTNPLAGGAVAKVFLSQGSSAAGSTASSLVQYN